jgi:hypothetical protein
MERRGAELRLDKLLSSLYLGISTYTQPKAVEEAQCPLN